MFQTLQSRLPIEMKLAGVSNIDQANEFLNSYIKEFNAQFALPIDSIKSVFEKQPDTEKINLILAVLAERKIDSGSCVKFNKQYYIPTDCNGHPVYYRKGTAGMVVRAFNKDLFFSTAEKVYALELILDHEPKSKNFDFIKLPNEPKKRYIPPMNHPWKQASFERFCDKQSHRQGITV